MKRIFITGGAGFIGSHLAHYHLKKGDAVWCLDHLGTGKKENLSPLQDHSLFRFTEDDLLTSSTLEEAMKWADTVYHMASIVGQRVVLEHPTSVLADNIRGCERLLEAAAPHNSSIRILIASSSEVYNQNAHSSFREDEPISFPSGECLQVNYALSKFVGEATTLSHVREHGLHAVIARLFNTTGPGQRGRYGMVVPTFIRQAMQGEPITVYGDGKQSRSFCDVRDSIQALDALVHHPKTKGEIINVGNDREISMLDLAHLVKARTHSSSEIITIPYKEAYGVEFHDISRRCPNLEKLRNLVDFSPTYSLETTIDAMKEVGYLKNTLLNEG